MNFFDFSSLLIPLHKKKIKELHLDGVKRHFGSHKIGVFMRNNNLEDRLANAVRKELVSGFAVAQRSIQAKQRDST